MIKGSVDPASPKAVNEIDGLSGASLTSAGVSNLVKFWLGQEGFGPFLSQFEERGGVTMGAINTKEIVITPIFNNNPIALQILGICSALAVTTGMQTALVMATAVTLVYRLL